MGLILILCALTLSACGTPSDEGHDIELLPNHVVIEMIGLRFSPAEIEIEPGTQVVFVNTDRMSHNVVHGLPREEVNPTLFESPILRAGQKWAYVFEDEGEYPYMCTVAGHHLRGMVGHITVRKPSS